ncbi:hypothetical protein B481_1141 [Planococcus halocryophilus Or1]|nr:hypothetical protein [Planococcus halocryophilus]EMF47545.1 hypothetical protein B481_1141 [Planococcus halocryophilus Or1]
MIFKEILSELRKKIVKKVAVEKYYLKEQNLLFEFKLSNFL